MDIDALKHHHAAWEEGWDLQTLTEPRFSSCVAPTLHKASEVVHQRHWSWKAVVTDMVGFTTAFMRCLQPVREGRSPCKSLSHWQTGWRNSDAGRAATKVLHWQVAALKGSFSVLLPVKLLPVKSILLQNETTNTLQARWSPVRGATGYRLTWTSAGRDSGRGACISKQGYGETGPVRSPRY